MTQLHSQLNTRAKVVATLERIQQGESLASLLDPLLNQVSEKTKALPMNCCLARCVNGGHSLVLVKAWLSMKSLIKAYGQPSISDCTNCCIWTRQITRQLVKRSKQSNNWIKVTVLDLSMPYCERCKKPCQICQENWEKPQSTQLACQTAQTGLGWILCRAWTSASPTCAHILTRQSQIL